MMKQLLLDLTQTIDISAIKTHISALHKQLGYGDEGPHIRRSLAVHLRSDSVGSCGDVVALVNYEIYLMAKSKQT